MVENRPGGGQNIGARACAEATPDGYTLCVMSSEPAVYNQFLYKSIPYDPEKDFQPIANLFFNTLAVVINPDTKVKTFAGMIAMAKAQPGKLSYGTFSFPATVFMDGLNKAEHTDIVRVPYKGGGEVVNAVLERQHADRVAGAVQHGVAAAKRPHHAARGGGQFALAAVSGRADLEEVRPGASSPADLVRLVDPDRRAAPDRREDRRRPPTASWPIRRSRSACTSIAASSRRPSGSKHSPVLSIDERKLAAADRQGVRPGAEVICLRPAAEDLVLEGRDNR